MNVSLAGSGYIEPRTDHMGHAWKEGRCTLCEQPMAEASSIKCSVVLVEESKLDTPAQQLEMAARAHVRAMRSAYVPGGAVATLNALARACGLDP